MSGEFDTPEKLAELLEDIGMRLHGKNRISGGESNYLWQLAETVRKAGCLAKLYNENPELRTMYGDAYTKGTIDDAQIADEFLSLLKMQEPD